MKKEISIFQEHGDALCIKAGGFTITFFPQQVSFTEIEGGYKIKIRPSLVETNIDTDDFVRLKQYSKQPTTQWLSKRASSALSEFISSSDDMTLIEKEWKKLREEIDLMIKG